MGTRLLSVRLSNGTATIDFSKELKLNHPGGSSAELQTIYAIVNSITLNITDISTVRILIGGERHDTLAGHIFIRLPLSADKKIISR
jgi:spore germination protein GerM